MTDEKGRDDKVLAVQATDPRLEHLRDIHHLREFDRLEIQHFFEVYKALEPGKGVAADCWAGRADAERAGCGPPSVTWPSTTNRTRDCRDMPGWWLLVITGLAELLIGFWAAGSWNLSVVVLVAWVGATALIRGITEIVGAFQLRDINQTARRL
jgi:hypothetical protein